MIKILDINSSYRKLDCDTAEEAKNIYDYFSIKIPNIEHTPLYKMGNISGKQHFISKKGEFLYGLKDKIIDYCISNNIEYSDETDDEIDNELNYEDFLEFVDKLNLPFTAYMHQLNGAYEAIINKRIIIQSFTGSGKSMIIYILIRYFMNLNKRILLLVPRTDLVTQMYDDFNDYFYLKENKLLKEIENITDDIEKAKLQIELNSIYINRKELNCIDINKNISTIYAGQDKYENKLITISTRDSLSINQNRVSIDYFNSIDILLADEVHRLGAVTSTDITNACVNADYKIGLTGSLSHDIIENLKIEGLIGKVKKIISMSEGISLGLATNLIVNPIYLQYNSNIIKDIKKMNYQEEDKFLRNLEERNKFIAKLALQFKDKNVIIIFKNKDSMESIVRNIVELKTPNTKFNLKDYRKENDLKIFISEGATKVTNRNDFRKILENSTGNILVATDKVITEGTNIKNVHIAIFSRVNKKNTTTIQACGRLVRLHKSKDNAYVYDLVDDLRYYSKTGREYPNYSYKHFLERLDTYVSEEFEVNEPVKVKLSTDIL